ncbi:hypothetical protein F8M41_009705 [Gigaspora margarita]|uniref:Uncharacterized protein n=1 Tax=Gigaspora margarita TaxID=4874 RepID=A0A8H3X3A1_GIGMA|nr:hypothetical protein F8M41_009705 [Gigaspora margarita]
MHSKKTKGSDPSLLSTSDSFEEDDCDDYKVEDDNCNKDNNDLEESDEIDDFVMPIQPKPKNIELESLMHLMRTPSQVPERISKRRKFSTKKKASSNDVYTNENLEFISTSSTENIDEQVEIDDITKIEEQLKKQPHTEWIVGSINITQKFRQYQLSAIDKAKKGALASVIVISSPCPYPYKYFTLEEWDYITKANPYSIKKNTIPQHEVPVEAPSKISEDLHRCNYYKATDTKSYISGYIYPDRGVNSRLDFSCVVDNIPILNSEIKPLGFTPLQNKKDFLKANLRAKKSINQQLSLKGGPNKSVIFTNMGNVIESFLMELNYDGIYCSWPLCKSKIIIDKASMPLIVSTFCHFVELEKRTNKLAEDFKHRKLPFTPPNQINFVRDDPNSSQIRQLLK